MARSLLAVMTRNNLPNEYFPIEKIIFFSINDTIFKEHNEIALGIS